jgi:hypothetical protein
MMAYDRYDTRNAPRDERSQWRGYRDMDRPADPERGYGASGRDHRGGGEERGFFERAGDQIASWFGDEDAERRRRQDEMQDQRAERGSTGGSSNRGREYDRDWDRDRNTGFGRSTDRNDERSAFSRRSSNERGYDSDRYEGGRRERFDREEGRNENRGLFSSGGSSEGDYNRGWRDEFSSRGRGMERNQERDRWVEQNNRDFGRYSAEHGRSRGDYGSSPDREMFRGHDRDMQRSHQRDYGFDQDLDPGGRGGYRPLAGDYARSSDFDRGGMAGGSPDRFNRSQSNWERDEYRETSRAGSANKSDRSREDRFDPHYRNWRDRHLSDLDRDYDDYRAENRSRFESDFGSWRERREQKRALLGQIREHMEVVGSDDEHIGTVDKSAGDRLILTKSDPESGGIHHSISCSDIDRVEGDKVILGCSADEARKRWRDESRGRALFEGDDQGEMGPRMLDRSFEGTYR